MVMLPSKRALMGESAVSVREMSVLLDYKDAGFWVKNGWLDVEWGEWAQVESEARWWTRVTSYCLIDRGLLPLRQP